MTQEFYHFDYRPGDRLLTLRLVGLWDESVVNAFMVEAAALRDGVAAQDGPPNGRILIDLTDYLVQPKTITEQIAALLPAFGVFANRVAVVRSASALQNMQADRLLAGSEAHFFASGAEAMAWLQRPEGAD